MGGLPMSFDWVIPLLTLSAMEIVLGIDNVIFIAILVGRLPPAQQAFGRRAGLGLALVARLLLLLAISWIAGLTQPLFSLADLGIPENWLQHTVSWRDVILLAGGLFLIAKSTFEIHHKLEGEETHAKVAGSGARFGMVLFQVALLDIVFSLDSVITAVGMVMGEAKEPAWDKLWIMVAAIVISMVVMLFFAGVISRFVHRHPTLKILALSFLILIGVMLVAEGVGQHIPRGYMYFAMVFAVVVEMLNLRMRAKTAPVRLHEPAPPAEMA
jgi:predicted tellurium resistance membrane protein TerC